MGRTLPRYPVYVPTKGRAQYGTTIKMLLKDEVPFKAVIEEPEFDEYAALAGEGNLLVLPFQNEGLVAARNWIKEHSTEAGFKRHWQLDDNIRAAYRLYKGERLYCRAGLALRVAEDFTEKYTNVAISGLDYMAFVVPSSNPPPFVHNCRVYSISLVNNELPYKWRRAYNDDTDICLQALAGGHCTLLIKAFMMEKGTTMVQQGGNTNELYDPSMDGRLKMARSLERDWPGVVETKRRFNRPQHVVKDSWKKFDTPLIPDPKWKPPTYDMELVAVKPPKSRKLQKLVEGDS